jgi:RNA polymerase sigma-70 factor, ECF subfamily
MASAVGAVTELLQSIRNGDKQAEDKLIRLMYPELRRLARQKMRRERPDHTLRATALVHEAYLRLAPQQDQRWKGRTQFLAIAGHLMRQVLIDHARAHVRQKRGGGQITAILDENIAGPDVERIDVLELNECLNRLAKIDPRQEQIVEMRFFGGLSVGEVAEHLGISTKTVMRDWEMARVWLYREMRRGNGLSGGAMGEDQEPF